MSRFLKNWTYPKHAIATTGAYVGVGLLLNAILQEKKTEDRRSVCPVKDFNKKQIIVNSILGAGYLADMTVTYAVISSFKKKDSEV